MTMATQTMRYWKNWPRIAPNVLGPFRLPKHHLDTARFGLKALSPGDPLANKFHRASRPLCRNGSALIAACIEADDLSHWARPLHRRSPKRFSSLYRWQSQRYRRSELNPRKTALSPPGYFQGGESYRSCTLKPDLAPPCRSPLRNRDRTV